jgi:hypothetical protein
MAGTIPLIRSGALVPFLRWMQANGRPLEARLRAVDLGYFPHGAPDLPIPLMPAIAFAVAASREDGADLPCRVVSAASVRDLGPIGRVALGARTVREALVRVAAALPHHVTHDVITVRSVAGGVLVRAAMPLRIDGETRHVVQQYVAALLQALCVHSGAPRRCSSASRSCPTPPAALRTCVPGLAVRSRHRATAVSRSSFPRGWRTGSCGPACRRALRRAEERAQPAARRREPRGLRARDRRRDAVRRPAHRGAARRRRGRERTHPPAPPRRGGHELLAPARSRAARSRARRAR